MHTFAGVQLSQAFVCPRPASARSFAATRSDVASTTHLLCICPAFSSAARPSVRPKCFDSATPILLHISTSQSGRGPVGGLQDPDKFQTVCSNLSFGSSLSILPAKPTSSPKTFEDAVRLVRGQNMTPAFHEEDRGNPRRACHFQPSTSDALLDWPGRPYLEPYSAADAALASAMQCEMGSGACVVPINSACCAQQRTGFECLDVR